MRLSTTGYHWTLICTVMCIAASSQAQEPTFMDAATHPGKGALYTRAVITGHRYQRDSTMITDTALTLKAAYGIQSTLALLIEMDTLNRDFQDGQSAGIAQFGADLKKQIFRRDSSALNTWRMSILLGATFPGLHGSLSQDTVHPRVGIVSTSIIGRHGLNGQLSWEHAGSSEQLAANASYLYRIAPARYSASTRGAWYIMTESLNSTTDKGESQAELAAGILYEAWRWAAELSWRHPIHESADHETDTHWAIGIRYLY